MTSQRSRHLLILASCLTLGACSFGISGDFVRSDAGDASQENPDGGDPEDARAGRGDSSVLDPDSATGLGDGSPHSTPTSPDSGLSVCDAEVCPIPCSTDGECSTDEYCSSRLGCVPRCVTKYGCAQLSASPTALASDAHYVYWGTSSTRSPGGGFASDGSLMAWDLAGLPFVVSTGFVSAEPRFAIDDTLYFTDGPELRRVPLRAGADSEKLASQVTQTWFSAGYVYWSVSRVDNQELWRIARSGGTPAELLHTASHAGFVGGDEGHVYHWEGRTKSTGDGQNWYLVEDDLPGFTTARDVFLSVYGDATTARARHAALIGSSLIADTLEYPLVPVRFDLHSLEPTNFGFVPDTYSQSFVAQGDAIYQGGIFNSFSPPYYNACRYVRAPVSAPSHLEELALTVAGDAASCLFAIHGNLLVHTFDGHLFVQPITPSAP